MQRLSFNHEFMLCDLIFSCLQEDWGGDADDWAADAAAAAGAAPGLAAPAPVAAAAPASFQVYYILVNW